MFSKLQIFVSFLAAVVVSAVPATPLFTPSEIPFDRNTINAVNVGFRESSSLVGLETLILCSATNCASGCFRFNLNAPLGQCQIPTQVPTFASVVFDNPTKSAVQESVLISFVPNACPIGLAAIKQTNTCFNLSPAGNGFVTVAGSTPL